MHIALETLADKLVSKVKHYLITTMGRTNDEANNDEFYRAFSYAIREEVMINWLAAARTRDKSNVRNLYYLSMEYLPGRVLSNNVTNICAQSLVKEVMQKLNRDYKHIISFEADPSLGNGGLGRLASCFLDSLATHHYPAMAYGLRYQYGMFEQQIWNGQQIEAPDIWLLSEYPWEFRRDLRRERVKFCGNIKEEINIHGDPVYYLRDYEEVRALPFDIPIIGYSEGQDFSVVTLRLWSTKESPRNFQLQRYNAGHLDQAAENTTLTDVLYPADYHDQGKRTRLKQEFLLVSASLKDIIRQYLKHHDNFEEFSNKVRIQINDTHPSLAVPELIRLLTTRFDLTWSKAVETTEAVIGYTNHTILSEALETWDQSLMKYLLPIQYKIIERLNLEFCESARKKVPNNEDFIKSVSIIENGKVRMANLAIVGSHKINGVAKLHGEILKEHVFKPFYELYPDKFTYVTNGVTQRRWLLHCNPDLAQFITHRIGDRWITHFEEISKLAEFADDKESQEEFLLIKRKNKEKLTHYLQNYLPDRVHEDRNQYTPTHVDIHSLFDVQIKRIHEYKRQLMNVLHIIMLYNEWKKNPNCGRIKRTFFFSGKAAASYDTAKKIILAINCIARKINFDPDIQGGLKVVFVQNYNVSKAEVIIPAAELSEQISTAGMEASGTGNMKLTINGALTIGTYDGANIEMQREVGEEWWPFSFGSKAEELAQIKRDQTYNSWDVCTNHPEIHEAVETLRDDTFAQNDYEKEAFHHIYQQLFEGHYGAHPDHFFVIKDLKDYAETQLKVEKLYRDRERWAKYCLHNIAGMGMFSADRAIKKYADEIWGITPLPIEKSIRDKVAQDYSEHDQCRIY
ncbi:MAG: glycogen/starch/alpha-glucan phosphorylase [Chlamydiales bacterium]